MQKSINIFDSIFGNRNDCIYRLHNDGKMITIKFARYDDDVRENLIKIMVDNHLPYLEVNEIITCLVMVN